MTPIGVDHIRGFIREYPLNPCHPRSILAGEKESNPNSPDGADWRGSYDIGADHIEDTDEHDAGSHRRFG
jgi:hypothetical protein